MHPLDGVRAKIARAHDHAEGLKREFDAFMQHDPNTTLGWTVGMDHDAGECVIRWVQHTSPPLSWAVTVGEIFYSLRSALDHLAWQLVIVSGGTPGTHTEFPVFESETDYDSSRAEPRKTRGMSDPMRAAIRSLQPFNAWPERPTNTTLWVIHDLCRIDKHQLLRLTDIWLMTIGAIFSAVGKGEPIPWITAAYEARHVRLEHNTELARYCWKPSMMKALGDAQMNMQVGLSLDIGLAEAGEFLTDEGEPTSAATVRVFVDTSLDYMNTTLLPKFEPFFA